LEVEAERSRLAAASIPPEVDAATGDELRRAISESYVGGFRLAMSIAAVLALFASATAALTIDRDRASEQGVQAPADVA
jgi:hypothetical protein